MEIQYLSFLVTVETSKEPHGTAFLSILRQNLSNFVSPVWKLHNLYCPIALDRQFKFWQMMIILCLSYFNITVPAAYSTGHWLKSNSSGRTTSGRTISGWFFNSTAWSIWDSSIFFSIQQNLDMWFYVDSWVLPQIYLIRT